jgi:hypothetical protein
MRQMLRPNSVRRLKYNQRDPNADGHHRAPQESFGHRRLTHVHILQVSMGGRSLRLARDLRTTL